MIVRDLGTLAYRDAWAFQEIAHASVLAGGEEQLIFVEHPPVITLGRRIETLGTKSLITPPKILAKLGIEVVQSDRGGDVTFHGPGQIVMYPIVRIKDHRLSVSGYVRRLLQIVIDTLIRFEISARIDDSGIGVWTDLPNGRVGKVAALGVRIRRGVSLHGIALNVETDLSFFDFIVPCGIADKPVTSLQQLIGDHCPDIAQVRDSLADVARAAFTRT